VRLTRIRGAGGIERRDQEQFSRHERSLQRIDEVLGQNADYLDAALVERQRAPDHRGVPAKPALP
jgi:hypothetical protein